MATKLLYFKLKHFTYGGSREIIDLGEACSLKSSLVHRR